VVTESDRLRGGLNIIGLDIASGKCPMIAPRNNPDAFKKSRILGNFYSEIPTPGSILQGVQHIHRLDFLFRVAIV